MKRELLQQLINWKNSSYRKPLILKGVRQVGKTYLLRSFGEKYFAATHYFNFESSPKLGDLFQASLDPKHIIKELSFFCNENIDSAKDLIIFDEIQDCPRALTSLKYFQENMQELALCSAGSLLGLQMNPISFPVGKVNFLSLYPLTFQEFLLALNETQLYELLRSLSLDDKIPKMAHDRLWERLKHYFIVGGLPECVSIFVENESSLFAAFQKVRQRQKELLVSYYADIAKHSGKVNSMHIDRIWDSIPSQLARNQTGTADRFRFSGIIPGVDKYSRIANAVDWLENAGLIIKVSIVNSGRLPSSAYVKENFFKLYLFDVGILGAMSNLDPKTVLDYDYGSYKGYFAENFVAQEFSCKAEARLFSWVQGNYEIEFLRQIEDKIIPVEVKSGWVTKAKSLDVYYKKYSPEYKCIFSAGEMMIDNATDEHNYSLYLAGIWPIK